jgi:dTDP-glucose 4,6-dehydratase
MLQLLEESYAYWQSLPEPERASFRFIHISTDEVYGSLEAGAQPATEDCAYAPNSPYAASKAASDHFARAYHKTYGLPVLITNCSNNYGPFQFPEKLIPLVILNAIRGKPLPLYGDGRNVRDWVFVEDHCAAIQMVLRNGAPGETYNVGGNCEKTNIDVVTSICEILDELHPHSPVLPHSRLIAYVKDRPGHDKRYAIDTTKICSHLGWQPKELFDTGLRKTVMWYLENTQWVEQVISGGYKEWVTLHYESGAVK